MSMLHPLVGNQAHAVAPEETVWLSASAGTGKTQVLSARVLRLLLQPHVRPEQILCLTFTKAGATEMAERINETLARWVRAEQVALAQELQAIGADITPEAQARARTLFASVLDCPGGGLRIDTIHAFAQWLLAAFPEEAGLSAGARPMEEQEKVLLGRQVLADLLLDAEGRDDRAMLGAVERLSLRMGPDVVERFLMRCAGAREMWFGTGSWSPPLMPRVKQALGLKADACLDDVVALCEDVAFDTVSLRAAMIANQQWKSKTGESNANRIGDWLAADSAGRLAGLDGLWEVFFTQKGEPRSTTSLDKIDPAYAAYVVRIGERIETVRALRSMIVLADWLSPALELGRAYALAWDEAKQREGLIDFDDQIARAADLLGRSDMADWIRYKLDRRFDHILVDEAQDTNEAQWRIIRALTEEFFAGAGARGDVARTLFVVGDYKQAIFGFQGTSPENFEAARHSFKTLMGSAAENAAGLRGAPEARELVELGLEQSFRTASPVLDFVDRAIAHVGPEAFGLDTLPERHKGQDRKGAVVLWRPVSSARADAEDDGEGAGEGGNEADNWLSKPEREMADRIAAQLREWHFKGFPLVKGVKPGDPPRKGGAGDVMILVRKRRELAGLIVARLHAAGVPVAGVDRLRLGAPLAVRDLVAALRFAAQPLDDLNLAALLVSPIFGWSQEDLLAHGYRPEKTHLWDHLRRSAEAKAKAAVVQLQSLLAKADFEPVPALIHWLMVGPWHARECLVARLGREANDPLDELINAAHAYSATATPSLAGFIAWFDAGDGELKREADKADGLVRVMTVHGSKGLQAPIVILADATGDPAKGMGSPLEVPDPASAIGGEGETRMVPLPPLNKAEKLGPIAKAEARAAKAEAEEYWRLLYVAMTRAEEVLFVGGALGAKETEPAKGSWYARLAEMFAPEDWVEDPFWGASARYGELAERPHWPAEAVGFDLEEAKPGWLLRPAPEEARPPRPLAPSALGEDLAAQPPVEASATRVATARRGVLIHALLERLPPLQAEAREEAARLWLARQARDLDEAARGEIVEAALKVLGDPAWADLFGPQALAEVPIAATVGDQVVAGTIDRLLVGPDVIRLVDFKTARRVPDHASQVPVAIVRQMAAYALALEAAYPARAVEVALLYTQGPRLVALPAALLAPHKQALSPAQQTLGF